MRLLFTFWFVAHYPSADADTFTRDIVQGSKWLGFHVDETNSTFVSWRHYLILFFFCSQKAQ